MEDSCIYQGWGQRLQTLPGPRSCCSVKHGQGVSATMVDTFPSGKYGWRFFLCALHHGILSPSDVDQRLHLSIQLIDGFAVEFDFFAVFLDHGVLLAGAPLLQVHVSLFGGHQPILQSPVIDLKLLVALFDHSFPLFAFQCFAHAECHRRFVQVAVGGDGQLQFVPDPGEQGSPFCTGDGDLSNEFIQALEMQVLSHWTDPERPRMSILEFLIQSILQIQDIQSIRGHG
mmetsp:Transcript_1234/g.8111  ORF Transcript_1234/g.8111 Transcript_1234/m.8111 type:complete len:229 (-) Transcript_1234:405-1091(-)